MRSSVVDLLRISGSLLDELQGEPSGMVGVGRRLSRATPAAELAAGGREDGTAGPSADEAGAEQGGWAVS
jgi:hypothetical protein